jgi:hypothetical protein
LYRGGGVTAEGIAILPEIDRIESEKEYRTKRRMTMTKSTNGNTVEGISTDNRGGAALQTTAEHFRMLVENMKDYAIIILDTDGRVASWTQDQRPSLGIAQVRSSANTSPVFIPAKMFSAASQKWN